MWEPPILDYSKWIEEEYEKEQEAMLEFMGGDPAATTDMMDLRSEFELLLDIWIGENIIRDILRKTQSCNLSR